MIFDSSQREKPGTAPTARGLAASLDDCSAHSVRVKRTRRAGTRVRAWLIWTALACNLILGWSRASGGAEYQWSVEVKGGVVGAGPSRAFLWIPPNCQRVRGILLAQQNLEEVSILEHPRFRQALSDLGFAEIWCSPAFDHLFRFNQGAGESFDGMMNDLADGSGYQELRTAPIVGLGHSAAASWPYYFAAWKPERALAALSVSGQWPYWRNEMFAPDIWGTRNIDFIPCLETMGEYESAVSWSGEGLAERQQHPLLPLGMLANPAQGHFAATEQKIAFLGFYLKKAVQYRMPEETPFINDPPKLKPIDPTKTGWLVDKWRGDQPPTAPAAPVGQYRGNPKDAFWFFDAETARTVEAYEAQHRGQKGQLVGYLQNGQLAPQHDNHEQIDLKFQPQADGITFKLVGTFLDTVPEGSSAPKNWVGLPVGSPVGHALGGGPVVIDCLCGPCLKLMPDTFAVHYTRGMGAKETSSGIWFAATHPGDAVYKPAVQQAEMMIPTRNNDGRDQHLTFPPIPDQRAGAAGLNLQATSDAGARVAFYVREGPAEVDGNTLRFTAIPPKAKFPVKVTVVACQYGRSVEPKLKTAESVERTFSLVR